MPQYKPAEKADVREWLEENGSSFLDEITTGSCTVTIYTAETDYHPVGRVFEELGWIVESVQELDSGVQITFVAGTGVNVNGE